MVCWEGSLRSERDDKDTDTRTLKAANTLTTLLSAQTGPSRCFPFWQDVLACYVVNTSTEDDSGKKKCSPVLEDYYECLHHRKEVRNTYPMEERGA